MYCCCHHHYVWYYDYQQALQNKIEWLGLIYTKNKFLGGKLYRQQEKILLPVVVVVAINPAATLLLR